MHQYQWSQGNDVKAKAKVLVFNIKVVNVKSKVKDIQCLRPRLMMLIANSKYQLHKNNK